MTSETTNQRIAVAIFAGGQSQRMGQDKAQLKINGDTLLERAAKTASGGSSRVYVVGRPMPENWPFSKVQFLLDETPHQGPLGALQTILKHEDEVLALACDLPKITSGALCWLLEKAGGAGALFQSGKFGLIVENADQWEPLFSIYTVHCLPLIEENLRAERRSLHALIKRGEFSFVQAPLEIQSQLANVNTPEEWIALKDR